MEIIDPLYGRIKVPKEIVPLLSSELAIRARGITMGTVPNAYMPLGPFPSRFQHGIGAMHLASLAIAENSHLSSEERSLIRVSALMHDWGNPPFAHMLEPLLEEHFGHNGETFLEELIKKFDPKTRGLLREMGLDYHDVAAIVTGKRNNFSKVVHGSLDLDNLDNLARLHYYLGLNVRKFDPLWLASRFRWEGGQDDQWYLAGGAQFKKLKSELSRWKLVRRQGYKVLYTAPHQVISNMMYTAAHYYAYQYGALLGREFFHLDDAAAFQYLLAPPRVCVQCTELMDSVRKWQPYTQVVNIATSKPSKKLLSLVGRWDETRELAYKFTIKNKLKMHYVTLLVGKDNQERKIDLPITDKFGLIRSNWDTDVRRTTYRVQLNIHPSRAEGLRTAAQEFVNEFVLS